MQQIQNFVKRHQFQLIAAFISAQLFILRRTDAFLNPQFWAEDGHIWYTQAYNHGLISLFYPANGYLQTISRLVANIAVFLPMKLAPLFYNIAALGFQILPASLVLTSRFNSIWPNIKSRVAIALVYVLITNPEVNMNVTNIQWHLAIVAFLILIADKPKTTFWKWFDRLALALACLSGPFCLPLLIVAAIHWLLRRGSHLKERLIIVAVPALIQATLLVTTGGAGRDLPTPLGASLENFVLILNRIFTSPIFGVESYHRFASHPKAMYGFAALCTSLVVYALYKGSYQLRLFALFTAMLFAASLVSPVISATDPQWQVYGNPSSYLAAQRYFLFPHLLFLLSLVSLLALKKHYVIKVIVIGLLSCGLTYGLWHNWHYLPYAPTAYKSQVDTFESLPKGTYYEIPVNPGGGWALKLYKR